MQGSLFWKLMAAFAVVILVGIGGVLLLAGRTTEVEFRRYAHGSDLERWEEVAAAAGEHYAAQGTWVGVEAVLPRRQGQGRGAGGSNLLRLADSQGRVVASRPEGAVGETIVAAELRAGLPIVVAGERVGTLLLPGGQPLTVEQQTFLGRVQAALAVSGGGALVVALVLGALLVRGITRPLRQLSSASRSIAEGELDIRVPVRSSDEVGQLAGAEEARRQQAADIAHELRTPLTVIQGHLEALADGVFSAEPDNLEPALEQTRLLARLVEDLRTLSLAEAGRLELAPVIVDVGDWAPGVVAGFRSLASDRGIALGLEIDADLPDVRMDAARMAQVLGNLLDNALRHTPEGGRVDVRVARGEGGVVVSVSDTGPGVPPDQLPRLFERFWRGDPSRSRRTGGSGLGLAIARRIVEAHGGRIWAEAIPEGGLGVAFCLPAV